MSALEEDALMERAVAHLRQEFPDRSLLQIATAVLAASEPARGHGRPLQAGDVEGSARARLSQVLRV